MKSKIYIFLVLLIIGCTNSNNTKIDLNRLNSIEELITKDIEQNNLPGAVVLVGDDKGIVYKNIFAFINYYNNLNRVTNNWLNFYCRK